MGLVGRSIIHIFDIIQVFSFILFGLKFSGGRLHE